MLLCPWDSPGKNTGVGCHLLLQGIFPTLGSNPPLLHWRHILHHWAPGKPRAVPFLTAHCRMTPCDPTDCSPPGSSICGDSPGKNTGVGCLILLQGIFPAQGSNPGLPHCRRILYRPIPQGSPIILEWVAYPFFRSSWPRNWTRVSWIAGGFPAELPGKPHYMVINTKTDVQFTSTSSLIINTNWIKMNNFSLQLFFFLSYLDFIGNQLMKHSKCRKWHHFFI